MPARRRARSVGVRVRALRAAALLLAQPCRSAVALYPVCVCEVPTVTCTVLYVIYKLTLQHKDEWTRLEVT